MLQEVAARPPSKLEILHASFLLIWETDTLGTDHCICIVGRNFTLALPKIVKDGHTLACKSSYVCSRRKSAWLCSPECMKAAWKNGHKQVCKDMGFEAGERNKLFFHMDSERLPVGYATITL
jgi:hypothetical protein